MVLVFSWTFEDLLQILYRGRHFVNVGLLDYGMLDLALIVKRLEVGMLDQEPIVIVLVKEREIVCGLSFVLHRSSYF